MWWIVSLVALALLLVAALAVTFLVMVALNGFPSLPDAFAAIYLVFTGGSIVALSVSAGLLAVRYAEGHSMPLWITGMLTTVAAMALVPVLLCGLTFGLLLAFGMI